MAPLRILLVGLMGSGKSTVGRALADDLGWPYFDNDTELAVETGHTLLDLASRGRAELHRLEAAHAVRLLLLDPPFVAGLAASIADKPELTESIRASAYVVYLRVQPATLSSRLATDTTRPWLAGDRAATVHQMFDSRDAPMRHLADLVLDADHETADDLARHVLVALADRTS